MCNWESFGEQLGNLRNFMEHDENTLGTHWEHEEKQKNWTLEECMLSLFVGCMKLLFPKLFVTSFGLG
jgi:hypothetical protein